MFPYSQCFLENILAEVTQIVLLLDLCSAVMSLCSSSSNIVQDSFSGLQRRPPNSSFDSSAESRFNDREKSEEGGSFSWSEERV